MDRKKDISRLVEATAEPSKFDCFLEVFANGTFYVVGSPREDNELHNCDRMGCSSIEHVLAKGKLPRWQVEDLLGIHEELLGSDEKTENGDINTLAAVEEAIGLDDR